MKWSTSSTTCKYMIARSIKSFTPDAAKTKASLQSAAQLVQDLPSLAAATSARGQPLFTGTSETLKASQGNFQVYHYCQVGASDSSFQSSIITVKRRIPYFQANKKLGLERTNVLSYHNLVQSYWNPQKLNLSQQRYMKPENRLTVSTPKTSVILRFCNLTHK